MEIKQLAASDIDDFRRLVDIFNDVFENEARPPDDTHLGKLLAKPDFMVFVVKVGGQVVGGLSIYVLHRYYATRPSAYIYDVGIAPAYQGRGLGQSLMAEVCRVCAQRDFEEAYVEAESDDSAAVSFYRKTNASHEMEALHFTYTFARP